MYVPYNTGIPHSQPFLLSSQPLATLPTHYPHLQIAERIQVLNQNNYSLELQITQLKAIMVQMQGQMAEMKIQLLSQRQKQKVEPLYDQQGQEQSKKGKFYAKDKKCWIEGCLRKYSSRIALNAHLRKVHRIFKTPKTKPI